MPIEKINIEKFIGLAKHHLVVDVRSPGEYNHAHIPGAYNLPLFTDGERKIVGTTYKQESREAAIKIGLDFFGPKMRKMVEEVESIVRSPSAADRVPPSASAVAQGLPRAQRESGVKTINENNGLKPSDSRLPTNKSLLLYCWRGGMRSAGVAWLMDLYGFKVYTLTGGYKKFRNYVLETFKLPFQFNILAGYTGSGKTEVLRGLKQQGETVVDLEEIAGHKGSAFGNMEMKEQPSQEMFENLLGMQLRIADDRWRMTESVIGHLPSAIWLEDESQRIGDINIPHELWKTMRQSLVYFLDIPFEERLKHILKEYGQTDKEKLINSIIRIQKRLGGLEAKNAINFLLENNTIECFRVLLKYYDKWYLKSLHNRENLNSLLINISCENVGLQNAKTIQQQAIIS